MSRTINISKETQAGIKAGGKLPTVGRMVHFFPCSPLSEGWGGKEKVYPAIVTIENGFNPTLTVFTDIGPMYYHKCPAKSEAFTESGSQHSHYWDWPEIK